MLTAAIVGLGWWGRQIAGALKDSEQVKVTTAADVAPDAVSETAGKLGLALTGFEGVLADKAIEAVILTTPHSLHEAQVLAALDAGKQVFCEKPFSLTKASAERMVAAAKAKGRILGIGHERRFEPAMEEVAKRVGAGDIGTLMHFEANFSYDVGRARVSGSWRTDPKEAPAAIWTGTGVHLSDLMISMAGPVAAVQAFSARRVLEQANGDIVTAHLRFAGGATGMVSCIAVTPFFNRFAVFGSGGWLEVRDYLHPAVGYDAELAWSHEGGKIERQKFATPLDTVRANVDAWAAAVQGGKPYRFTTEQIVANTAVVEAVGRSAATGELLKIG
ncbi:MAG: Gfo/Idh/MocA family protein [Alphaproteobacteria bacterium]